MLWLRRGISTILSLILLFFSSCSENRVKILGNQDEQVEISELDQTIDSFFVAVQNEWDTENLSHIDSLGIRLSELSDSLSFFPFHNDYSDRSFIFSSKRKSNFDVFLDNEVLNLETYGSAEYKVWRRKSEGLKVLDFSLEPHPVLTWVFTIRKRGQE